jgi:hypothetical protein
MSQGSIRCPACGAVNAPDARECRGCRNNLLVGPPPAGTTASGAAPRRQVPPPLPPPLPQTMGSMPYGNAQYGGSEYEEYDYKEEEYDSSLRFILPVGRSGLAIAAGYLGLFSIILFPAPLALLFGMLAMNDLKKNPKKLGMGRAVFGIVAGSLGSLGLMFVVWGMMFG